MFVFNFRQLTDLEESKEISLKKLKENYEKQLKERNKKLTEVSWK